MLSEGDAHEEVICDEITGLPEGPVGFRITVLPTGESEAMATVEYAIGGVYRTAGKPFVPGRHTWVGARLALFAMPIDGGEHGGHADFGPVTVEPIDTL